MKVRYFQLKKRRRKYCEKLMNELNEQPNQEEQDILCEEEKERLIEEDFDLD